eukprot:7010132-Pyramimonas_sp.AAC.1
MHETEKYTGNGRPSDGKKSFAQTDAARACRRDLGGPREVIAVPGSWADRGSRALWAVLGPLGGGPPPS